MKANVGSQIEQLILAAGTATGVYFEFDSIWLAISTLCILLFWANNAYAQGNIHK